MPPIYHDKKATTAAADRVEQGLAGPRKGIQEQQWDGRGGVGRECGKIMSMYETRCVQLTDTFLLFCFFFIQGVSLSSNSQIYSLVGSLVFFLRRDFFV
jgi:hypothetical protein